jgi:hypothetical protein
MTRLVFPTYGGLIPFTTSFFNSFWANDLDKKILINPGPLISHLNSYLKYLRIFEMKLNHINSITFSIKSFFSIFRTIRLATSFGFTF